MYMYMFPHLVLLLILEFFPARLAMLPYGLDSNVTQQLENLLKKHASNNLNNNSPTSFLFKK